MGAKKEKEAFVEKLTTEVGKAKGVYLAEVQGIEVNIMNSLRKKCRESRIKYVVAKNTLAKIAFNKAGISTLDGDLKGPTAILIAYDEGTAPAKVLTNFLNVKENQEKFRLKRCVVEGVTYQASDVSRLATVPSRDVLLSQLCSVLQAPMQNIAGALSSILRQVPTVIDAVAKQKAA